jgi:hypothetical protein
MTKKLNVESITNELKEQSAFFRSTAPLPEESSLVETQQEKPSSQAEKSPVSAPVVPTKQIGIDQPPSTPPTLPSVPDIPETVRPYDRTVVRTDVRTDERTSVRRTTTRYAFEFFRDQIETLKQFSLDEKMRGEKGSMSEMIREAVDMYISKRRNRDVG